MANEPPDDGDADSNVVDLKTRKPGKRKRLSTIDLLPADVRAALNAAIEEGRMTVDDLWVLVRDKGGDVSRSAVHRHKMRAERGMEEYRRMQEMAAVWKTEREKDPEGAISQLLNELIKNVAFQRLMAVSPKEAERADPKDLVFLSNTIKNIAQSDKIGADRELTIRKATAAKAAAAVDKVAKATKGLSADTIAAFRAAVLKSA